MTTALSDFDTVKEVFREQCEAYLIKPIEKDKLIKTMRDLGMLDVYER